MHLTHRIGAVITLLVTGILIWLLLQIKQQLTNRLALILTSLLAIQITLGLLNIILVLPLVIAVAHNGVAALLLAALVSINRVLVSTKKRDNN